MGALLTNSINVFFKFLYIVIFVRVLLSWFPQASYTAFGRLLYTLTEPIMAPVRRMMDKSPIGGSTVVDFSPVIALFILDIIQMIMLYIAGMF